MYGTSIFQHVILSHLSISYDIISTKFCDKRNDFDFEIVDFPLLALHPMESISLISFDLLEQIVKEETS